MNEPFRLNKGKTSLDKLVEYLRADEGTVNLTPKEREQAERINYADNLISRGFTDKEIANAMKKKWQHLSLKTFLNDCNDARYVHGSNSVIDKQFYRKWLFQRHLKTHKLLEQAESWKALVSLEDIMRKTLGLDKADDLTMDPADYGNHNYYFILNAGTVNNQNNYIQVDLKQVQKLPEAEVKIIQEQIEDQFNVEQSQLLQGFMEEEDGEPK